MRRLLLVVAVVVAGVARADDLRLDFVRHSLTGTHVRYQQFIDGLPVVGGERIEHVDAHGNRSMHSTVAALPAATSSRVPVVIGARRDLVYVNDGGVARLAIRRIESDTPHERYVRYYDAASGELVRSTPLFFHVAARVFDPNPVAKLNDPALRDQNNSADAVPNSAYSIGDLAGLPASGPLVGPNVQIVDIEAPFTTRADASQPLFFDRSQPQFEEVNAYFHIDRSQRYMQSLGYTGDRRIVGYAIPVDAHAAAGSDNSFFSIGDVPGEGTLFFGDGGTDDAEDSDIMLHEFAHAIHESIAPGVFSGSASSEGRAMAEGFADYWAFSSKYEGAVASGRDPFCIADWDARCWTDDSSQRCGYPVGADCLRRVDGNKTMSAFLRAGEPGTEHENGEIWSSALREIFVDVSSRQGIEQGRRIADTIVLESLFSAPSNPTLAGQAQRMLDADAALNGGANARAICRAMTERAVLIAGACDAAPRGELTVFQSTTSILHIDDTRAIEDILVRVEADGAATLTAPDGTTIALGAAGSDVTYGFDALPQQSLAPLRGRSAAGDWKLTVTNGTLRSWSLLIQFAGDDRLLVRPTTFASRKHIFAAAHIAGAAGRLFVTDVRIYNRTDFAASLLLIFTPSGVDGRLQFAALRLSIAPHQMLVLNDVVRGALQSSGIGQLELLGDTESLLVNSRTYSPVGDATYGDTIPSFDTDQAGGDQIAPLENTLAFRSNVGAAEVGGAGGVARFTFFTADGQTLGFIDVEILPFGHAQVRVPFAGSHLRAEVSIVSGNPQLLAYGSVIDNSSGDAITIPATRLPLPQETVAMPAIHSSGVDGTEWRTDLWRLTTSRRVEVTPDVGRTLEANFLDTNGDAVSSRTYTETPAGVLGQFVPALHRPSPAGIQEILGIEESSRFRTNLGLVNFADAATPVLLVVYDSTGAERSRLNVTVGPRSLQQVAVAAIVSQPIVEGRVEVRGAVTAYGSVIDNHSQDPSFIVGQY